MQAVSTIGTGIAVALLAVGGAYLGAFWDNLFGDSGAPAPVIAGSAVAAFAGAPVSGSLGLAGVRSGCSDTRGGSTPQPLARARRRGLKWAAQSRLLTGCEWFRSGK